jgi:hypothetical protein
MDIVIPDLLVVFQKQRDEPLERFSAGGKIFRLKKDDGRA